jgi:phage-related baseplate assembly protein
MTINANRFIAPTINIADLPLPDAIEELDAEAIIAARMARFQADAEAAGFPYDVGALETDPIKIDQEAHAFRELLMRSRVNSAVRAVLPAYAQKADLDAIAARANVGRQLITPADPVNNIAAVYEDDTKLLVRYLTSFAVPSAGSEDGYIYRAVTAVPALRDVAVLGPAYHGHAGRVYVRLLWEGGADVPDDAVQAVIAAVRDTKGGRPLTDDVVVSSAPITPYSLALSIQVPPGPAPDMIEAAALAAVRKAADARYAIGAQVWLNYLAGAAYVANVQKVTLASPAADVVPDAGGAAYCTDISVSVEVAQ